MMHGTVLRLLTNRLLTEKAFAENPAMTGTPVDRPLFVIGFPRTGTTIAWGHMRLARPMGSAERQPKRRDS